MNSSSEPALSVIVTCYNEGHWLLEAVASAENNCNGQHEIILVDGGTKHPETLEALDQLAARGLTVLHVEDRGPAVARNAGIRRARGRYILPLDADNRLRPDYIERGIVLLDTRTDIDVVYGDPEFFGGQVGRRRRPDFRFSQMLTHNYIDTCAVFRKSAWERVGGFDEHPLARGYEDWDFWMRVNATGGNFHHVDEVLFEYRVRENSLTAKQLRELPDSPWLDYFRAKPLPLTWGRLQRIVPWEHVVLAFRHRPVGTVISLVLRAYFPGLRRWWLQRVRKLDPQMHP